MEKNLDLLIQIYSTIKCFNRFMVSWWVTKLYLNNEQFQIGEVEIMTSAYSLS